MKTTWYQLPEDQCERLMRPEMSALKWCFAALNSVTYGQDDLAARLKKIPNGTRRWNLMLGQLRALLNDIIGTVPVKQCQNIKNTMNDMELRLVPKTSQMPHNAVVSVDDLTYIVKAAKKSICTSCTLMDGECRTCELYKILETISPLEDYGSGMICPYMKEDWWDR